MQPAKFHHKDQVVLLGNGYIGTVVKVIRHNNAWLYRVSFVAAQDRKIFLTLTDARIQLF
jgi:hypothetical protein